MFKLPFKVCFEVFILEDKLCVGIFYVWTYIFRRFGEYKMLRSLSN
jgi:hypothetical protein